MKVFGIAGRSGMGKTTLLERLVPELGARGLRVSLIKHSHKDIEIDRPGKDSWRLRDAGCHEVLLLGERRWALMHELRGAGEPSLDELLPRLQDCELVLVEGFKGGDFPSSRSGRAEPPAGCGPMAGYRGDRFDDQPRCPGPRRPRCRGGAARHRAIADSSSPTRPAIYRCGRPEAHRANFIP